MYLRLLLLAALFALSVLGQGLTSLSGVVSDPSGAVVPNANLTLEDTATAAKRETVSDSAGNYTFAQIRPGTYKLSGKAAGFREVIVNEVRLLVNTPATVNVVFEHVGSVSEVVSVSAEAIQINTVDASLGNAIGTRPIQELPLFARNPAALLAFQPGVTFLGTGNDSFVGADPFVAGNGQPLDERNGAVNGGKSDQANITLDGVDVNNQQTRRAFQSVLRVTLDSVQEFRTTTLNAPSDQGRTSGAQISLVTRSGTNELHGALYEFHRNTITSANRFFNNSSGVQRPALLINVFGGRLGGPIVKNKLFYFFNYEGRRDASATTLTRNVPSDLLRQGVVQYLRTDGSVGQLTPQDLKTRIDPTGIGVSQSSLQLLQSYPHPNDSTVGDGLNIQGYRFAAGQHTKFDTYIAKFDWAVDSAGKHQAFLRGQLQNDRSGGTPQFPGEPPNSVGLDNSKGIAVGLTSAFGPTLVNNFRYGFTRQGSESTGILNGTPVTFRNITARYGTTTGRSRIIPVHHLTDDFSFIRGAHSFQVGGTMRRISNESNSFIGTWHTAQANLSWLLGTGAEFRANLPDLSTQFRTAYGDAVMAALGVVSQVNANYNYTISGSVLPQGAPIARDFRNAEYEWYIQDTWKATRSLTVTLGLRHSLMPPVYEANGVQTSPSIPLDDWFAQRVALMNAGQPTRNAGLITFNPISSPAARPFYPFHKKNFAPRVALAYSPQADNGLSRFFFGGANKTSIRAGFGMFYDLFGQGIIRAVDSTAFGLSTQLTNPASSLTGSTAPRFTGFYNIPTQLIPAAPTVRFPVQQPVSGPGSFAITNTIDDKIKPPYSFALDLSIQRELGHGFMVQAAYVGRLSRRSLISRDMAMPANLKDPASGMTYFEAAQQMAKYSRPNSGVASVPKIPYFENLWPQLATGSLTATQAVYNVFKSYPNDETSALVDLDLDPATCSRLGCNAFFNPQFSALATTSSIGNGNYHAMQWTARKRFGAGLEFDFNYTYSKSIDLSSETEWSNWAGALTTGYNGFLVNSFAPRQRRGVSDYDSTHIWNGWAVWQLPFGRGQHWGSGISRLTDALIGGWQLAPTLSASSGLPLSVGNGRVWPTNWNITGLATIAGPVQTAVGSTRNAPAITGVGGPNVFADPRVAIKSFDFTLPGESGNRNILRGDGPFAINLGVSKTFQMPYKETHKIQLRGEAFNLTNTARFNVSSIQGSLTSQGTFGKYTETLGGPRQMQFALRYEF